MSSFFTLVGFEYKKLFKRKSTIVSSILVLLIMIVLCLASFTANSFWHSEGGTPLLEAMKLDKEVVRSKAGLIDEAFINEAISRNAFMISNDENYLINDYGKFLKNNAYIDYVLPYENVVMIINAVYEPDINNLSTNGYQVFNLNGIKPIDTLTSLRENDFYEKIKQTTLERINSRTALSEAEKAVHMQMLSKVETPLYNDYYEAYSRFTKISMVIALTLLIAIAVCLSPIFAGEYQSKTDQILLAAKYGKNKVIFAKLFTGTFFALAMSTVILFGSFFLLLAIHGSGGFSVAMQIMDILSTYPLTVLQAVLIAIAVSISVSLFFSVFTMLLSSWFKSPFSVVIISVLVVFVPTMTFISPQNRLLYQLIQLFPGKAIDFFNLFSDYFFEVLGVVLIPATFYVIFYIVCSLLMLPFIYRFFKNHQVG